MGIVKPSRNSGADVLLVSQAKESLRSIEIAIGSGGYQIADAATVEQAQERARDLEPGVVVIDATFEPADQLLASRLLLGQSPATQVILLSAANSVGFAIQASNDGVFWLLNEPLQNEDLLYLIARALVVHHLTAENLSLRKALQGPFLNSDLVAESEEMRQVVNRLQKIAALDATVLITGESGTGKTMLASEIHRNSSRKSGPFISLSCANLPRDLLESELFGHEKGAFTGATSSKPGTIELCDGGTLFLDEIGELPLDLQPKLLTFLQDRQFRRLGGKLSRVVDVRIVCATNRDLVDLIREGAFREDLYYRVNVLTVDIPPLRSRVEDISFLARRILDRIVRRRGLHHEWQLSNEALAALRLHSWPGNIRELEHTLERATAFAEKTVLGPDDLELRAPRERAVVRGCASLVGQTLRQVEEQLLTETLSACDGDKARAAEMLGVSTKTVYNKLREFGMSGRGRS